MEAFYNASMKTTKHTVTEKTYRLWRDLNPYIIINIDYNKLANVRRGIQRNKRLAEKEINDIKKKVMQVTSQQDQATINDNDIQDRSDKTEQEQLNNSTQQTDEEQDMTEEGITNTETSNVDEMKEEIMIKWQEIKHQKMEERPTLPKVRKDNKVTELLECSNKALEKIKKNEKLKKNSTSQISTSYIMQLLK
jgi:hypothetical protein